MRILLFGKNGQLGWELQRSLALLGDVIATDSSTRTAHLCGDLSDLAGIRNTILQVRPDVVVNAAAYTNVDLAESETQQANLINHRAPEAMAEAAKAVRALLVHYSTDYVFKGSGQYARAESSAVEPINAYGQSKLQGEIAVRATGCDHLIFRTSWVYAARGHNFLKTMLRLAAERNTLSVVADQVGTPTGAELIADVSSLAIHAALKNRSVQGLYHLTAAGHTSWHEYASLVVDTALKYGATLTLPGSQAVKPLSSKEYVTPAERPANSRLDCGKLMNAFGLKMPAWQLGVERVVRELVENK